MKINRVRYLKGPNYFAYVPTVCIDLDLEEMEDRPSDTLPGFTEALLRVMPTLASHTCSKGYPGGFVERLKVGTWMGHILEHMALELQNMAGIEVNRGKTVMLNETGHYQVTYEFKEPESAYQAFLSALSIVESLLENGETEDVTECVRRIESIYYKNKLGPSTEAIYQAAITKKIPVERIGKDSLLRLGTGKKQKYVQATITSQTSNLAVESSCDKSVTKEILRSCGLPVPEGEIACNMEEIFEAADRIGFPLVIKPFNGRQGQGVITHICNKDELFNVVHCLDSHVEKFIVERHYEGHDYRLTVVDGKLVASSLRLPPYVIGNGHDTIRHLIEKENLNPLRGEGHEKPMSKIPLSHTVSCYLEKSNRTLETVPDQGEIVQVVGNANLSTGGKAIDVTEQVHPSIQQIAVNATRAIGLDIAGIDWICKDISKPFDPSGMAIIEVNAAPGIRMHHYPSEGKKRDVGKAIVDYLFPTRQDASIPVIAVTGTNGKTTTARLVHYFLSNGQNRVGMTNSDGIFLGMDMLEEGDCSGPISAKTILAHPETEIAVLETARGGILREGLAFERCDIGIITNVTEDHLGCDGIETLEDLVKLKRLIAEVVHKEGVCILNADDAYVASMQSHTDGEVIFTSLCQGNPLLEKHRGNGGKAWYVDKDGMIVFAEGKKSINFLACKKVPITIEGKARHNIENVLQALAAAFAQGIPLEDLRKKAQTFMPDSHLSRGRFNLKKINGRTVIVDYAHNAAGLEAIFDTVSAYHRSRLISVLAGPGDRIDEELVSLAEITAHNSDKLIIKEDDDLRGRPPLYVANLLEKTALDSGMKKNQVTIVPNELDAFFKAWETSQPGDLLLFFYTDFTYVEAFFKELSKKAYYKK